MTDETLDESPDEPLDETTIGPHTERVNIGQPRKDALCGAKTSAGTPCRRRPIRGGTKCALHGGGSPLARQAAERRLLYGTSLAIDRLIDALSEHDHEGPCALCGCSPLARDPVAIRAAIALLDRSGFCPECPSSTLNRGRRGHSRDSRQHHRALARTAGGRQGFRSRSCSHAPGGASSELGRVSGSGSGTQRHLPRIRSGR